MTNTLFALLRDDRARVPFALVGVLLLATSTMLVVSMELQDDDPVADIDEDLAMDRSEAAAVSSLGMAAEDAVVEAGKAPVTDVNESSTIGQALIEANDGDVFENYVRLRIYHEATEQLDLTDQQFDQDVRTTVGLSPIHPDNETDEVVTKLERVGLDIGHESQTLDTGKLTVTLENVGFELEYDGDVEITERRDVQTTIGTTIFELREKTETYEEQLDKGFFEGGVYDGLSQKLAARMYAVAYIKSGAKYAVAPEEDNPLFFDEILPNNQTEVLANHAVFSVQDSVFDTQDPYSSRVMRAQTGCLLAETAGEMAGDDFEYVEEVCKGLEAIYGDIEGDQPEVPSLSEVLQMGMEEFDAMEEDFEVEIDHPAGLAVRDIQGVLGYENPDDLDLDDLLLLEDTVSDITGDDIEIFEDFDEALGDFRTELDGLFDDIYTVETTAKITEANIETVDLRDGEGVLSAPAPTDPDEWVATETPDPGPEDVETVVSDITVEETYDEHHPDVEETIFTVSVAFEQEIDVNQTYEYVGCVGPGEDCPDEQPDEERADTTVTNAVDPIEFELSAEYAPDATVRDDGDRSLEFAYTDGGDVGFEWANYDGTPEYALNKTFDPHGEMNICEGVEDDIEVDFDEADLPVLIDAITDNDWVTAADTLVNIDIESVDQAQDVLMKCFDWDVLPDHIEDALEPEDILDHRVDEQGQITPAEFEADLEDALEDLNETVTDVEDVTDAVGYEPDHELMAIPRIEGYGWLGEEPSEEWVDIKQWLDDELEEMVSGSAGSTGDSYGNGSLLGDGDPSVEPATAPRYEWLDSDNDPILQLVDNLREVEDEIRYQDVDDDQYETVMDMARTEMYDLFVETTEDWIYDFNHLYNSALESVEETIDAPLDGIQERLDEGLGHLQDFLNSDPEFHEGELSDQPLYDDVTYEVHGSPTYLSMDVAERDVVPTVRPGDEGRFAGLDDPRDSRPPASTNHSAFYAEYTNHLPYPGLPILPPPWSWVISLSTWDVEVGGEYARFEVSAAAGGPDRADSTTYVREQRPIHLEFDGEAEHVGDVEPINFRTNSFVTVIMPGGDPGVGDGGGLSLLTGPERDCSITAPYLGPDFEDSDRADDIDYDDLYPDNEDPIEDSNCW